MANSAIVVISEPKALHATTDQAKDFTAVPEGDDELVFSSEAERLAFEAEAKAASGYGLEDDVLHCHEQGFEPSPEDKEAARSAAGYGLEDNVLHCHG